MKEFMSVAYPFVYDMSFEFYGICEMNFSPNILDNSLQIRIDELCQ